MGPEVAPGYSDDSASRGPQINPSGPSSDVGGRQETRKFHLELMRGQEKVGSCVAAACRNAIVGWTGTDLSEEQIRKELQVDSARPIEWDRPGEGGIGLYKATKVLQAHGLPVQEYWEVTRKNIKTTADLVRVVSTGPVMLGGHDRAGGNHVMLLLKTQSDGKGAYRFWIVDSSDGDSLGERISPRWMSQQEFEGFWTPDTLVIQFGPPR
jgi:hypothetical protein